MTITNETRVWMYERMLRSRHLEEKLVGVYFQDKLPAFDMRKGPLPGEIHFSWGQEPVGAGVCAALGVDDAVTTAHRPHHVAVARDADLRRLCAELLHKADGLSEGRGGHMHLYDSSVGFSCSSIVGEGMGPTAGMALARKMRGRPGVAVTIIGEGAVNQGVWHETMNIASLWKLPFVCVIEDNYYGVTVSKAESTSVARNSDRASAYGCAGEYVEGNDADAIYAATRRAVERARNGEGPTILEVETARLKGHYAGDQGTYIPADVREKFLRDPLPVYRERLLSTGALDDARLAALEQHVRDGVEAALRHALDAPYPNEDAALEKVFA